jgi:signal transduction histidine kinase
MFWKLVKPRSLKFRINLLVSGLFILSSFLVFLSVDITLSKILTNRKDAELQVDVVEFYEHFRSLGRSSMIQELNEELASSEPGKDYFGLVNRDGQLVFNGGVQVPLHRLLNLFPSLQIIGSSRIGTLSLANGKNLRLIAYLLPDKSILYVGKTTDDLSEIMEEYRETFSRVAILVLIGALLAGWVVGSRAVSGINRVAEAARQIEQGHFEHRVLPCPNGAELAELSTSFNHMAHRVQSLLGELEEVSGNVAHDLRSPLTRIRGVAESAIREEADENGWAGSVVEECDRMIGMIDTMLDIARMNTGLMGPEETTVSFSRLLENVHDLFRSVADDKGIEFQLMLPGDEIVRTGDERHLQRMMANLVDNALKFTPPGGLVSLALDKQPEFIRIVVTDNGPGIRTQEQKLIFRRFYRGEQSRSTPGSGLGLTLAQAIARSHGGDIKLLPTPGSGSQFVVSLPFESNNSIS